MTDTSQNVLEVRNLKTYFYTHDGFKLPAVDGVTFSVKRGKILAVVGESGCGKSVTAYSVLRLIQKPGKIVGGKILLRTSDGKTIDIASLGEKSENRCRWLNGYVNFAIPASIVFSVVYALALLALFGPSTHLMPIFTCLAFGVGTIVFLLVGLHRRRLWGWILNWFVLVLGLLVILLSNPIVLVLGVLAILLSNFINYSMCIFFEAAAAILWTLLNAIYFWKRRYLFTKGRGRTQNELFHVRGGLVSMIFQEPMTALSPVHSIGNQICEAILLHQDVSKAQARQIAVDILTRVGIPGAAGRMGQYPHEFSGGMRQRVVIAMALACKPQLLIADEPTTALDVTLQAQVLKLIKDLQADLGTSVLFITHDLAVVAQMADEVAVMYLGRIVEQSDVRTVLKNPRHPYTRGLLKSLPGVSTEAERLPSIEGTVPSLTEIPPGCPFHPRCPYAEAGTCDVGRPPELQEVADGHRVACARAEEVKDL